MTDQIGSICDEWDYQHRRCASQVAVYQRPGTNACFFTTKMAIDADEAPKGYYPGESYPSNNHDCFDWLDNLNVGDRHGIQGQNGALGPAAGFLISGTALTDEAHYAADDTRCYVDASSIPYVVLTGYSFPLPAGATLRKGCLVFVVDTKTGIYSGAIYADVGRAVGEASLALALMLGMNPFSRRFFPKVGGGTSEKRIFHLVFPAIVIPPPWPVSTIQQQAKQAFDGWGGEAALRELFPRTPPMSGPRPVVIKRPDASIAGFEEEDEAPRQFKGADEPRAALE